MARANIEDAARPLYDAWPLIRMDFAREVPGYYLELACVYRSVEEQFELYKIGRTMDTEGNWIVQDKSKIVTYVDGYKTIGKHNTKPATAIDVVVMDNQKGIAIREESYYDYLGPIVRQYGLRWGGDWDGDGDQAEHSFLDRPHIEIA